jgi:hypothetical protein
MPYFGIPIRNGLPIGLGSVAGFGVQQFSPADLFSAGEQGAWYDPSDVNINWRRNLLQRTEEFNDAAWAKTNITAVNTTATIDPLGGTTAEKIASTTGTWPTYTVQTVTPGVQVFSVYAKQAECRYLLMAGITFGEFSCYFDLQNGTSTGTAGFTRTMTAVGNGWYRCTVSGTFTSINIGFQPNLSGSGLTPGATGDGVYIWGAQLELGSTASLYQQIVTPEITYLQTIQPNPVLFQDSAGTTPVTAVEQYVGLMLDKSKGLVLGSELITPVANQDFSSDTGYWTKAAGVTIGSGICTFSAVANNFGVSVNGVTFTGKYYDITFTISSVTSGSCSLQVNGPQGIARNAPGTYTERICAGSGSSFAIVARSANTSLTIDSVSVKEVTGNHATQTTSAKRPKLAARYNLLTYTEQFDNGAWTKSNVTVTANAVVAPDGTMTADALFETAANSDHGARTAAGVTVASGVSYKLSFRVKSNGRNYVLIYINAPASGRYFDVTPGTAGAVLGNYTGTNLPATITALADNWFLCEVTFTASTTSVLCEAYISSAGNNLTYAGDITKGIYIWGADLRPASQATGLIGPTYQRVVDAATYDAVGFLPYLQFDGIDDSMSTNSIDFTATDKMTVWAGARKLSDATRGMVAELQDAAGSFQLNAPVATSPSYRWASRGSIGPVTVDVTGYAAPISNVLTGIADIANDTTTLRINGVQVGTNSGDQGTGNYGNYPLNIGQRGGSSLPFNGWLTSLIVRGAQSTQSQIEATESWVNGKTGAY